MHSDGVLVTGRVAIPGLENLGVLIFDISFYTLNKVFLSYNGVHSYTLRTHFGTKRGHGRSSLQKIGVQQT